jgi:nitroreductase
MLASAPLGFVVCGDLSRANGQAESYLLQDCSACTENLLLALSMLGLGGVWLGVHPREDRIAHLRALFGLPGTHRPRRRRLRRLSGPRRDPSPAHPLPCRPRPPRAVVDPGP